MELFLIFLTKQSKWTQAKSVMAEFYDQGDQERERGKSCLFNYLC